MDVIESLKDELLIHIWCVNYIDRYMVYIYLLTHLFMLTYFFKVLHKLKLILVFMLNTNTMVISNLCG